MATLHRDLTVGKTYVVTSANGCTVTLANGVQIELQAGQDYFTPDTPDVTVSDNTATVVQTFNHAPGRRGSGGDITVDPAPTQGSENAVSSGGVYTALRELPAPVPEPLEEDTAMRNGGVYTVDAAGTALDFSAVTLPDNATAEVWIECTAETNITWPDAWLWQDGSAPQVACDTATEASHRYRIVVLNEGAALDIVARVAYDYSNLLTTA